MNDDKYISIIHLTYAQILVTENDIQLKLANPKQLISITRGNILKRPRFSAPDVHQP